MLAIDQEKLRKEAEGRGLEVGLRNSSNLSGKFQIRVVSRYQIRSFDCCRSCYEIFILWIMVWHSGV